MFKKQFDTYRNPVVLTIGAVIICYAQWFTLNVTFSSVVFFDSNAWAYGPREFVHFIGFIGFVMSVWAFLMSFGEDSPAYQRVLPVAVSVSGILALWVGNEQAVEYFGYGETKAALYLLFILLGLCVLLFILRGYSPGILKAKRALVITVTINGGLSLFWELIAQPLFDVYGRDPRGYVQFAQVSCDITGILIGAFIVLAVIRFDNNFLSLPYRRSPI